MFSMLKKRGLSLLLGSFLACLLAVSLSWLIGVEQTEAAVGDIKVTVKNEALTAAIVGATVEVQCTGGAYTSLTGTPVTDASGVVQAAPDAASSCDDADPVNVKVIMDGYVTDIDVAAGNYVAAGNPSLDYAHNNVQFSYKITDVTTEVLATNLVTTLASLQVGDDTGKTACAQSGGVWYCPVPLAQSTFGENIDGNPVKDGYVAEDLVLADVSGRAANTDAQESTTIANVKYGYKVTAATSETGTAITDAAVNAGDAYAVLCSEATGVWYCIIPVVDTSKTIQFVESGYVTDTDISFDSDRAADTDAQQTKALTGIQYAQKITVTREASVDALTGATVNAGTGPAVLCNEDGVTGIYYCALPFGQDGTANDISIVLDGYVTHDAGDTVNRADDATAQGAVPITGVQFSHKVIVVDELGTALTPTSATGGVGDTSCEISANSVYCPVPLAGDNVLDATTAYAIVRDGYVTAVPFLAGSRAAGIDAQRLVTLTANTGVQFSNIVTVRQGGTLNSQATVTAGNSFLINCNVSGTSGIYYCVIPLADTELSVRALQSSSSVFSQFASDRTAGTNTQVSLNIELPTSSRSSSTIQTVAAATNTLATLNTDNTVKLTWTKSANAASYELYRGTGDDAIRGIPYAKIAKTLTEYTDQATEPGKLHKYVLRAISGDATANSAMIEIKVPKAVAAVAAPDTAAEQPPVAPEDAAQEPTTEPETSSAPSTPPAPSAPSAPSTLSTPVRSSDHWANAFVDKLVSKNAIPALTPKTVSNFNRTITRLEYAGIVKKVFGSYAFSGKWPDRAPTRAEALKMAFDAAGISVDAQAGSSFNDVDRNHWSAAYIVHAKSNNVVSGYSDGTFKPSKTISYAEAIKILSKVAELAK